MQYEKCWRGAIQRRNIAMQMFEIYSLIMWFVLVFFGVVVALWHCLIDMAANSLFRIAEGVDEESKFLSLG